VHKMSLSEYQKHYEERHRQSEDLERTSFFNSLMPWIGSATSLNNRPEKSEPVAPTIAKRIEQERALEAHKVLDRHENLFFSDLVEQSTIPIQRFFPSAMFDPHEMSRINNAQSSGSLSISETSNATHGFVSWWSNLRKRFVLSGAKSKVKVWENYEKFFPQSSSILSASSIQKAISSDSMDGANVSISLSSDHSADSSSSSDVDTASSNFGGFGGDNDDNSWGKKSGAKLKRQYNFVDRAFPVPTAEQFKRCQENSGKGVWDSFGVWRCLLPDSTTGIFDINGPGKSKLFERFEDYLQWKGNQNNNGVVDFDILQQTSGDEQEQELNKPNFCVKSDDDSTEYDNRSAIAQEEPNTDKKIVGRGTVWSSTIDKDGKRVSIKKTQTYYDDGSVIETV
ncbi:hypothetical protein V1511DRAFT_448502, partial [Dipodascopsis uninucleata]